jgi:hypothetical protein
VLAGEVEDEVLARQVDAIDRQPRASTRMSSAKKSGRIT